MTPVDRWDGATPLPVYPKPLAAAFMAADDGGVIGMPQLIRGVALEYGKHGRLALETDFSTSTSCCNARRLHRWTDLEILRQGRRTTMDLDEKVQLLSEVDLFQSLDREDLERLAEDAAEREYGAGQPAAEQDEPVNELWIIDGTLELSARDNVGSERVVNTLGRPQPFGEAALYDEGGRMVSARAAEDTHVLAIDGKRFRELVREHPDVAEALISLVASRLRQATTGV